MKTCWCSAVPKTLYLSLTHELLCVCLKTMYASHRVRFVFEMKLFVFLTFCFTSFYRQRHKQCAPFTTLQYQAEKWNIEWRKKKKKKHSPKPKNTLKFICFPSWRSCFCLHSNLFLSVFVIKWEIWDKKPFFLCVSIVYNSKWISLVLLAFLYSHCFIFMQKKNI